jgi:hypothetical protein
VSTPFILPVIQPSSEGGAAVTPIRRFRKGSGILAAVRTGNNHLQFISFLHLRKLKERRPQWPAFLLNHEILHAELAKLLGLAFQGDGERYLPVSGWDTADRESLIFIDGQKPAEFLPIYLPAACVITTQQRVHPIGTRFFRKTEARFLKAAEILMPRPIGRSLIHPTAI